ncbi:MAG: hypothetical protein GX817_04740 [Elusimicrobia bacterium]|nr:hypothetical protein [Elusimicrobiota bacterium]
MKHKAFKLSILIVLFIAPMGHAIDRLGDAVDFFSKDRYPRAKKILEDYLLENPWDELAIQFSDIITIRQSEFHLRRAYTLISEGAEANANNELNLAAIAHPGHFAKKEAEYTELLKKQPSRQAASYMIADMLNNPTPSETQVNEIVSSIRECVAGAMVAAGRMSIEVLNEVVGRFRKDKEWDQAIKIIVEYLSANSDSIEAEQLLSEISSTASEDYYNQAVNQINRKKLRLGRELAEISRKYNSEWFEDRIERDFETARTFMAMGELSDAKKQLEILKNLDPNKSVFELYLSFFKENPVGFFDRSLEKYRGQYYEESSARFDYLRVREPENNQAQLYYHLSLARNYIRDQDLEKIRVHLIHALEISPGEQEALDIFDRLQDVMEIMKIY